METSPLKDKRIALLGGIGSRPEAKAKLIEKLGLAELEWVSSERNGTKEYEAFCSGLYPGKYDYIFVLTKFSSHTLMNKLKSSKPDNIPLVKIKGSYNSQNFLAALFEQVLQPPKELPVQEPPKPIITKTLEPALPDTTINNMVMDLVKETDQEVKRWQEMFGAPTPEKAMAKIEIRVKALEARNRDLSQTQQDKKILNFAYDYISAMDKFIENMPTPGYVADAKDVLVKALKKHGFAFEKIKNKTPKSEEDLGEMAMKTNLLFCAIFAQTRGILEIISQPSYDRYGACEICKMHKNIGCMSNCPHTNMKTLLKFFNDAKKLNPDGEMPELPIPDVTPLPKPEPIKTENFVQMEPGGKIVPASDIPRKLRRLLGIG